MRKRFFSILIVAVILSTACGPGATEEMGIEVRQALVNIGAQGEDSPIYLALRNHDSNSDQLTGVSSDAAEAVQLHAGIEVVDVIPVHANAEFVFIPDGYHMMLVGLRQELQVGDQIEIILHFRDHPDIALTLPVQEAPEHGHGDH